GRVVVLTVSDEEPKEKHAFFDVAVDYLQPTELLSDSPKTLIQQLQKQPSLIVLKQLLSLNDFDAASPIRFRGDWNLTSKPGKKNRNTHRSLPFLRKGESD